MKKRYDHSPPHHSQSRRNSYKQYPSKGKSRSRSRDKHSYKSRHRRQHSRSQDRNYKSHMNYMPIKQQSDIKNHFRFQIPHLSRNEQTQMIAMLKNKLIQFVGPIEHVTSIKQSRDNNSALNVGFKYDIDALSYLQAGELAIKIGSHKIRMNPIPTKAFQMIIGQMSQKHKIKQQSYKPSPINRSRQRSSSSSNDHRRHRQKQKLTKVLIFGVPSHFNEQKVLAMINQYMGGSFFCKHYCWRKIRNSNCEYFQFQIQPPKAQKIISYGPKMLIDGHPVVIIEDAQSLSKALSEYQFTIQLPKKVYPFHVLRGIQYLSRVVQITVSQQPQQDGKYKIYTVTINDSRVAEQIRRTGRLSSGIIVEENKYKQYVYRPSQNTMLPIHEQLV